MRYMRAVLSEAQRRGEGGAREAMNEFYALRAAMFVVDEQGVFDAEWDDDDARKRTADAETLIAEMLAAGGE